MEAIIVLFVLLMLWWLMVEPEGCFALFINVAVAVAVAHFIVKYW